MDHLLIATYVVIFIVAIALVVAGRNILFGLLDAAKAIWDWIRRL